MATLKAIVKSKAKNGMNPVYIRITFMKQTFSPFAISATVVTTLSVLFISKAFTFISSIFMQYLIVQFQI